MNCNSLRWNFKGVFRMPDLTEAYWLACKRLLQLSNSFHCNIARAYVISMVEC